MFVLYFALLNVAMPCNFYQEKLELFTNYLDFIMFNQQSPIRIILFFPQLKLRNNGYLLNKQLEETIENKSYFVNSFLEFNSSTINQQSCRLSNQEVNCCRVKI